MKKLFALIALAAVMCCCNNNNNNNQQPTKTDQPNKNKQEEVVQKSNKEMYPEKFEGIYIVERALSYLTDIPEPKTVKSVAVINDNVAKVKFNYLEGDHEVVLKFDNGDWLLGEIDGASPNR